ncbi:MAG: riboflavin biosynthesis protein RibF [Candidatus Aminicenantes bacterium]|nr:riboflavin biosynthesis protein RibF [Candidatus Aminicenantes bacterium]
MRILRSLASAAASPGPRAVAVGNFDGCHLGHRRILARLKDSAREKGLVSLLLTFSPHPENVLGRGRILMIQTLRRRLELVGASGIDQVLVMPFDSVFASLSPAGFIDRVLVAALKARVVFVGRNFRFGRGRQGTVKSLRDAGRRTGRFEVCVVTPVTRSGKTVSSSLIRRLLHAGKVREAGDLLGRPYELSGRVVRGRSLGRRLGFPTANIRTENEILPPGIFVSRALVGSKAHPGLTYIGRRPTFGAGTAAPSVETFLLGFGGSLYGREVTLQLLRRLRSDRKFPGTESLAAQIGRDVARARHFFRSHP